MLALAFALDFILGDPPNRFHPVRHAGNWAELVEKFFRKICGNGFFSGMLAALFFILPISAAAGFAAWAAVRYSGSGWCGMAVAAASLYICFAPRGLAAHALRVLREMRAGSPDAARRNLGMMVGRNTEILDDKGVIKACVESVAENFTDGVASPIFFAVLGWLIAGWPGAAAFTVLYRLSNTLDSMWGKLNECYRRFGTFAARLDDVLNFVPARLAWLAVTVSAPLLGLNPLKALVIGYRDSGKHESPNSAWTEAAFSGALGVQLGGSATYGDRTVDHPLIGEPLHEPDLSHISKSVALLIASSLVFAGLCIALAYAASLTGQIPMM